MSYRKKGILLGALIVPVVAYACMNIEGVSFHTNIGAVSTPSQVPDRVQSALGGQFGRDKGVSGVVMYSVSVFGVPAGLHSMPVDKPCGQTFKERLDEVYNPDPVSGGGGDYDGGGGGMGGGGGGGGGGGWNPPGDECYFKCNPTVVVG